MLGFNFIRRTVVLVEWIPHRDRFNYNCTIFLFLFVFFSTTLATKYLVWWLILSLALFYTGCYLSIKASRFFSCSFFVFVTSICLHSIEFIISISPQRNSRKTNATNPSIVRSRNSIYLWKTRIFLSLSPISFVCVCFSFAWFSSFCCSSWLVKIKINFLFLFFWFYYTHINITKSKNFRIIDIRCCIEDS